MSTLHTVNKSPFERSSLKSCLDHVSAGDAVLLIEDGVVGARKGSQFAGALAAKNGACAIYALGPDLAARGMKASDLVDGVKVVDYAGFVDLAAEKSRVCAWL
ncbi:MAG: sulfurtransferase complex subunit TusB [Hyphomicrobiales bacterium]|nr:sulfurtransferase complex subunit TusB [Hyphomicrobiales bacterium]